MGLIVIMRREEGGDRTFIGVASDAANRDRIIANDIRENTPEPWPPLEEAEPIYGPEDYQVIEAHLNA